MGTLIYGGTIKVALEDRMLRHIELVIGAKLLRDEAFFVSWRQADDYERVTVWVSKTIPLVFAYQEDIRPTINEDWIHLLADVANSPRGLVFLPEPHKEPARSA